MMNPIELIKKGIHFLVVCVLTIVTQIGGIPYLLTLYLGKKLKLSRLRLVAVFLGSYLLFTFVLIPILAPMFGRSALPVMSGDLRPLNLITCLLNRHYVKPELLALMIETADKMNRTNPGLRTLYLDANFPFIDGFPLIPHLSHNDGKKLDLTFYYDLKETGKRSNDAPSFIGYGIYDDPKAGEEDYPVICMSRGYWQYGAISKLVPQYDKDKYTVDANSTAALIKFMADNRLVDKIFIEPHLKKRWRLAAIDKVRFHGCQAVRHDDHIHVQIK